MRKYVALYIKMTISNFELAKMSETYGLHFTLENIIMNDELKDIPLPKRGKTLYLILNSQKTGQSGMHWVAFIVRGKYAYFFDSYGAEPDSNVINYCQRHRLNLGSNNWIIQSMKSTNCGLYCFGLILFVTNWKKTHGVALEFRKTQGFFEMCNDYVNLYLTDAKKNDAILLKYLSKN